MNIFIDVGAHEGQTLAEVLQPGYQFDRVYAFEPMPAQYAALLARYGDDPALVALNFGLSDRNGPAPLYGHNRDMEASIHPTKSDVDDTVVTVCDFVDASDWFALEIGWHDTVTVKINCEGAECAIIADLAASGEIWKIARLMVDFDIRKIPGLEHLETDLLAQLAGIGYGRLVASEEVMQGETHQGRIANWLALCPI